MPHPPLPLRLLIVCLMLLVILAATAGAENAGRGVFALEDAYELPGWCTSLAIADFDQDGDSDVTAVVGSTIRLYRNQGGKLDVWSGFDHPGGSPQAVDVNRDGRMDLLTVTSERIVVFRGLGALAFERVEQDLPGVLPNRFDVADLDGDDWLDIALSNRADSSLTVLYGTPSGGFEPGWRVLLPGEPGEVACGDLDGEARPEVAIGELGEWDVRPSRIWLIAAGESRLPRELGIIESPTYPWRLELMDVSGDRRSEIFLAEEWGGFVLLGGTPDSGYAPLPVPDLYIRETAVAAADLDADGRVDLVVNDGPLEGPRITVLFDPLGPAPRAVRIAFSSDSPYLRYNAASNLHAHDMDEDGVLDLVLTIGTSSQSLRVIRGLGYGRFSAFEQFPIDATPLGICRADLDGGGRDELLVNTEEGVMLAEFDHRGQLDSLWTLHDPLPGTSSWDPDRAWAIVRDLNADGREDLVMRSGDSVVVALAGPNATLEPDQICGPGRLIGVEDFDGDGDPDLLTLRPDTTMEAWWNDGAGGMCGPRSAGSPPPLAEESRWVTGAGDVDGDGRGELLWHVSSWLVTDYQRERADTLFVGRWNGAGFSFDRHRVPFDFCLGMSESEGFYSRVAGVTVADLDGRLGPDLLIQLRVYEGGLLMSMIANERGGFDARGCVTLPWEVPRIVAADFDLDGSTDVGIGANMEGYAPLVRLVFTDGEGRFSETPVGEILPSGKGLRGVAAADLLGDDSPDLAVVVYQERYGERSGQVGVAFSAPLSRATTARALCTADPDAIRLRWTFPAAPAGTLERRASPDTLWRTLGWPNRDGEHDLVYVDRAIEEGQTIAYRLRAPNGTIVAGSEVTIVVPQPALRIVSLGPNPARGDLTLRFRPAVVGPARAEVFDLLGRRARTHHLEASTLGDNSAPVSLAALAPGIYFLRLEQGAARATARFAIVR